MIPGFSSLFSGSGGALPERPPEISGRRPLIRRIREILEYGLELIGVIITLLILSLWLGC